MKISLNFLGLALAPQSVMQSRVVWTQNNVTFFTKPNFGYKKKNYHILLETEMCYVIYVRRYEWLLLYPSFLLN